jgi:ribonuclease BN (tRNA processing enzyme)
MKSTIPPAIFAALVLAAGPAEAAAPPCARHEVAVQVLGSGGPMHGGARGGSAYLLWVHHQPAAVIDMGGDTATKLAAAGVEPGTVGTLLISHLHPDHVSGLPDFLWGEITAQRTMPLTIAGPDGGGAGFPDIKVFLERQFAVGGLYPRMQGMFDGTAFPLSVQIVALAGATQIANQTGLKITALPVKHGPAPALAYRVEGADFAVVFGGDQTYADPGFSQFAADADLLVMHAMVVDGADGNALTQTVGLPRDLGLRAAEAHARHVILSHFMRAPATSANAPLWSLNDIDAVRATIARAYRGRIDLAENLGCYPVKN